MIDFLPRNLKDLRFVCIVHQLRILFGKGFIILYFKFLDLLHLHKKEASYRSPKSMLVVGTRFLLAYQIMHLDFLAKILLVTVSN